MDVSSLCIFGTRPEAIKMAPIIKALKQIKGSHQVCVTGQHQQMLQPVLELFAIDPDYNLAVMTENQSLSDLTAAILIQLDKLFLKVKPKLILVHGDTTTTLAASLCAYYHRIAIVHIEAGLRTQDIYTPWPEEANRKLTSVLTALHFAPTKTAKNNLLIEGIPEKNIFVTGNTVIDALQIMVQKLKDSDLNKRLESQFDFLKSTRRLILVTGHRRENFGAGFEQICQALIKIAELFPNVDIVYPVHLNPYVRKKVNQQLAKISNIFLIAPVDYLPFVYLMKRSYCILTDSGGIQEEAPSLGKPVLVMRDITERPEAVDAKTVQLVGARIDSIVAGVQKLLSEGDYYQQMSRAHNPYGDGQATQKIIKVLKQTYWNND